MPTQAETAEMLYIKVWRFRDAPRELQGLSEHGGDEDWLALVPPALAGDYVPWLEYGEFGCSEISIHPLPDGSTVRIGAHA